MSRITLCLWHRTLTIKNQANFGDNHDNETLEVNFIVVLLSH